MKSERGQPQPPLINCVMLVRWPERREMIQQAVASFAAQDYPHRTLTIVNDGSPCRLSAAFTHILDGRIVQLATKTSVGEKRNRGVTAVPHAAYSASFDDDDFSLPHRLTENLNAMERASACWLSASRKYIAIRKLDNIVGFELGRCYGAGMVSARVTSKFKWPDIDCFEDQKLFEVVRSDVCCITPPEFGMHFFVCVILDSIAMRLIAHLTLITIESRRLYSAQMLLRQTTSHTSTGDMMITSQHIFGRTCGRAFCRYNLLVQRQLRPQRR